MHYEHILAHQPKVQKCRVCEPAIYFWSFWHATVQHPVFKNVRLIVSWISSYKCCRHRKQSRSWSFVNLHIGWIYNGSYHLHSWTKSWKLENHCKSVIWQCQLWKYKSLTKKGFKKQKWVFIFSFQWKSETLRDD